VRLPLNLVTLMFGSVVRVRLVISIMFPILELAVVGVCCGCTAIRGSERSARGVEWALGGPIGGAKFGPCRPGESGRGLREPEESLEFPLLPLSERGGL